MNNAHIHPLFQDLFTSFQQAPITAARITKEVEEKIVNQLTKAGYSDSYESGWEAFSRGEPENFRWPEYNRGWFARAEEEHLWQNP